MNHTLALSHVLSAGIAVMLVGVIVAARTKRHDRQRRPPRRTMRRIAVAYLHLLTWMVWAALCLMGRPVANRRYGAVEPLLGPFEALLTAHNHRPGHAACVPVPIAPYWFLRCRACRAWVLLREVPRLDGVGLDLHIVRGSLDGAMPCPARYLSGSTATPPRQATGGPHPPTAP